MSAWNPRLRSVRAIAFASACSSSTIKSRCPGAPALKEAVSEAVKNGQPRLVIDMEGVSFVDSSGLGSVVAALKQVRSSKGDLRLAAPNQQVRVVLELTTLDRVFPYFASVEEALTDF